ncbi:thymidylate kinase [Methanocella sp. MCL-LM]|uniref:thymidylate kinase n=1 Tax=Methanocella sp. MCL-LM TaxID=3412035 RepID=UPI003C7212CD
MRFIVIDGLDGSGKDTQARLLKEYFSRNGNGVIIRAHPAQDNRLGRISKKALMRQGQLMRMVATLFYGFDVIRSILLYCKKDNTVIFVRYIMASAYLPRPIIRPVYAIVSRLLPTSDEMFFLDVAPEEALRRVKARGEAEEMFETLPHMEKVRGRAMLITKDWKVVDGNGPPEQVFQRILDGLQR